MTSERLRGRTVRHYQTGQGLQLSGDVVTNLQLQIDGLREKHNLDVEELKRDITLLKTGLAYAVITCKTEDGRLVEGIYVSGFCNLDKEPVSYRTTENGKVSGYVSPASSVSFSISKMLDIKSSSLSMTDIIAGNRYEKDFIVEPLDEKTITQTGIWYCSSLHHSANVTAVGGGGGGGGGPYTVTSNNSSSIYGQYCGGGGGGGNTVKGTTLLSHGIEYAIKVGSGGTGGAAAIVREDSGIVSSLCGNDGGSTECFDLIATGGQGGGKQYKQTGSLTSLASGGTSSNGGNGGKGWYTKIGTSSVGSAGSNGTIKISDASTQYYGGGGGGGNAKGYSSGQAYFNGGASYGGHGALGDNSSVINSAASGSNGGGGGGGYGSNANSLYTGGGSGGSGLVHIVFQKL